MWPYVAPAVAVVVSAVVRFLMFREALRDSKPTERPKILRELRPRVSISMRRRPPED